MGRALRVGRACGEGLAVAGEDMAVGDSLGVSLLCKSQNVKGEGFQFWVPGCKEGSVGWAPFDLTAGPD